MQTCPEEPVYPPLSIATGFALRSSAGKQKKCASEHEIRLRLGYANDQTLACPGQAEVQPQPCKRLLSGVLGFDEKLLLSLRHGRHQSLDLPVRHF